MQPNATFLRFCRLACIIMHHIASLFRFFRPSEPDSKPFKSAWETQPPHESKRSGIVRRGGELNSPCNKMHQNAPKRTTFSIFRPPLRQIDGLETARTHRAKAAEAPPQLSQHAFCDASYNNFRCNLGHLPPLLSPLHHLSLSLLTAIQSHFYYPYYALTLGTADSSICFKKSSTNLDDHIFDVRNKLWREFFCTISS